MAMIRAGDLDRRITIEKPSESQNAVGEVTATWSTLATVWAARDDERGAEYFQARQTRAERSTVFRIRYRSDVTEKMRVDHNSIKFGIEGIVEVGRQDGLDLFCVAEVP